MLIEGGHDRWNAATAKTFKQQGGRRVLFACGQDHCRRAAESASVYLSYAKVETDFALAIGEGHACFAKVADRVRQKLPWLLSGDERWGPWP